MIKLIVLHGTKRHSKQLHKFWALKTFRTKRLCHSEIFKGTDGRMNAEKKQNVIQESSRFCLNDYDVIGFDLDNTVLNYNLAEMVPLEYNCILRFMVDNLGYPSELLGPVYNDVDFFQKGLILDTERGNILKINSAGKILKASHGLNLLSEAEIIQSYGPKKTWDIAETFAKNPLSTWNGPLSEKVRALLDCFDMPASLVFGRAVNVLDRKKGHPLKEYNVYKDMLSALISIFRREAFAERTSNYFESLRAHPLKYIMKTDAKVIKWLKELKKHKATFLLTGSHVDFVNLTASTALGEDWKSLFDVIVCFARKPAFFIENRPFYKVEGDKESIIENRELKYNTIYTQGNWRALENLFIEKLNKSKPKSLYIGDNLIQDVYAPSNYANFDTLCVSEEMLKDKHNYSNIITSNFWGSYFSLNKEDTLWFDVIKNYSKMCIPSLDYLADKPITYKYRTKHSLYPMM